MKNNIQNLVEKLVRDPFLKNQIEHTSGSTVISFIIFFLLCMHVEGYRYILKLRCTPFALTSVKAFLKNKNNNELFSLPHFLDDFSEEKYL